MVLLMCDGEGDDEDDMSNVHIGVGGHVVTVTRKAEFHRG